MQDNKNLILAVVLCLIVLFGWGYVAEYMGWAPKPRCQRRKVKNCSASKTKVFPVQGNDNSCFTPSPGRDFPVNTPLYDAVFYTGGGSLRSFVLKNYHTEFFRIPAC